MIEFEVVLVGQATFSKTMTVQADSEEMASEKAMKFSDDGIGWIDEIPKRIQIAAHLSVEELEVCYRRAKVGLY